MEIEKKRTLTGIFIKYIGIFCISTMLLAGVMLFAFIGLVNLGAILPANYMETWINDNRQEIAGAEKVTENLLPVGCTYGVYDAAGKFLYGSFEGADRTEAWEAYLDNNTFARDGGFYRFLLRKNEEVCIIRYFLKAQAANAFFRKYLPAPDICMVLLFLALFLLQAVLISRYFARMISKRLRVLNDVTEKIRNQNLEIEEKRSDIREIDEVLVSLSRMGEALHEALHEQWNIERHKREQVAALAHDIKTPLTIIKGNAELLSEEELHDAGREYNQYIRENVAEIEHYLVLLQDMLISEEEQAEAETIPAGQMAERLVSRAKALAAGYFGGRMDIERKIKIKTRVLPGEITCDTGQIQRAWDNIVSNALEYSLPESSRPVLIEIETVQEKENPEDEETSYLAARVTDTGNGFTKEELLHAAEQFFKGDKSRHEKKHRGLGLYTASEFAKRQGGRIVLENAPEEEYGGRVSLFLKCVPDVC